MSIRTLLGLVDNDIIVSVSSIGGFYKVRLRVVEKQGIWVESEEFVSAFAVSSDMDGMNRSVVFLPFAQIRFVLTQDGSQPRKG